MFKFSSVSVCVLLALLVITNASFAQDWILEWYVLDPILDVVDEATNTHQLIYGDKINADLTLPGQIPEPGDEGEYIAGDETFEVGEWKVRDYDEAIMGTWDGTSLGIYDNEFGSMDHFTAHAIIAIGSPVDQDTVLHLGYDDHTMVYLNGEDVVYLIGWTDPLVVVPIDVHLNKGLNILMLQVHDNVGGDHFEAYFEADNLEFFSTGFDEIISVSLKDKLSTTWGNIKFLR